MADPTDYQAVAVKRAVVEKFGRQNELQDFHAISTDRTIALRDGDRVAKGTRDDLLAAVRKATSYDDLWEVLRKDGRSNG
jgi:hypothetical protein